MAESLPGPAGIDEAIMDENPEMRQSSRGLHDQIVGLNFKDRPMAAQMNQTGLNVRPLLLLKNNCGILDQVIPSCGRCAAVVHQFYP